MEAGIVHQQLNAYTDSVTARNTLVCYLQYLVDYRRDVPEIEEYFVNEMQGLSSTKYVKQLAEDDPIYQIVHVAEELDAADKERNKAVWTTLKNHIFNL
jgi:hypothetical protein